MYKIAIVQNEKELFKYDCADWSKLIVTNALNSQYIYTACVENREKIEKFINTNHEFYVDYSSKKIGKYQVGECQEKTKKNRIILEIRKYLFE